MIKKKKKRIRIRKGLSIALTNYTQKSSPTYCPVFDAEIRTLRPDWFETPSEKAAKNKTQLLKMARNGEPKPSKRAKDPKTKKLGGALISYTNSCYNCYDLDFDTKIRAIPTCDWFVKSATTKKTELLKMARNGEPKPSISNKDPKIKKLGSALTEYITEGRRSFCLAFSTEIRAVRNCNWFIDTVAVKKEKLLKMAKDGKPRPTGQLRSDLNRFINNNHPAFDPIFNAKIRAIFEHSSNEWFKLRNSPQNPPRIRRPKNWFTDIAAGNKKELLRMARNGELKPSLHPASSNFHKLGYVLHSYTHITKNTPKAFDSVFNAEIRAIPNCNWYINSTTIKKTELLKMAKDGKPRPSSSSKDPKTKRLGSALSHYTNEKRSSFCAVFNKKIRELRPDWFKHRCKS